jgi:hypothetical protein
MAIIRFSVQASEYDPAEWSDAHTATPVGEVVTVTEPIQRVYRDDVGVWVVTADGDTLSASEMPTLWEVV